MIGWPRTMAREQTIVLLEKKREMKNKHERVCVDVCGVIDHFDLVKKRWREGGGDVPRKTPGI